MDKVFNHGDIVRVESHVEDIGLGIQVTNSGFLAKIGIYDMDENREYYDITPVESHIRFNTNPKYHKDHLTLVLKA